MNELSPIATNAACEKKRDRSYLIWTFLIPFSCMLLVYVLDKVFPFGTKSVLVLDLNAQYVGFFEALRDFVYGDASLLYSFSRSLGGEMMGIYAYYLASPLSYIVALFPAESITEALLTMFVLKAGLCGLTFGLYLHKKQYAAPIETVMFSTLYALSSFAVVMQHNTMWIDNLILLPLVTWGVENVIRYRRFRLFVFALSLSLLSNYYIGFMTCIYVLLYFFYYFYAFSANGQNNPLHEKNHYLRALIRMALYSLLAVAIAAIILLTASYSLSFGKTSFTEPNYIPYLQFNPLQFFAKMLPGVYDTVEPTGFPFVFCGSITLLLVPLYFLNRRFPKSERISSGVFLAVFYLSMSISTLDMLWHGGQAPNWLNYRYSFILCFVLLVLASRAFACLRDLKVRTVLSVAVVLLALLALTAAMEYEFFTMRDAAIAALLLVLFTALLLYLIKCPPKARQYVAMLMLCVVLAEVLYNGTTQITALHEDVGTTNRRDYRSYHEEVGGCISYIQENDATFYRTEVLGHRVVNDPMELGYRGLTGSTSTLNAQTIAFLHRLGLLSTSHWSEYYGGTLALDSLFGIRYMVVAGSAHLNEVYTPYYEAGDYHVYHNSYALPLAFAAAGGIADYDITLRSSPLARQNDILRALLGEQVSDCYLPLSSTFTYENLLLEAMEWDGVEYHACYSNVYLENEEAINNGSLFPSDLKAPETSLTFQTTVPQEGQLYFYIDTALQSELKMYVNGEYYGTLFGNDSDFVKGIGRFSPGETVTVTLTMANCSTFYFPTDTIAFYLEDEQATLQCLSALAENGLTLTTFRDDYFKGSLTTTQEKSAVQTTIPYDAGWIIMVDGQQVTGYETMDALLAFDTTPGSHEIELIYRPSCYVLGKVISLTALALFLTLILLEALWRRGVLRPAAGSKAELVMNLFFCREALPTVSEIPPELPSRAKEEPEPEEAKTEGDGYDE